MLAVSNYLICHNKANADSILNDSFVWVGQRYNTIGADQWQVIRGCLVFDTSSIPPTAVINAVTISVMGRNDVTIASDFDITIVSGVDLADIFVAADYGELLNDIISFGELTTVGFLLEDWNIIPLNALGIAAINIGGTTRFGLRSSRDIATIDPKGNGGNWYEWIAFYGMDTAGKEPRLTVTYTTVPEVQTNPATEVRT